MSRLGLHLIAAVTMLGLLPNSVVTANPTRAADQAGSASVGSTAYRPPSGAIFVATSGNDNARGTQTAPVRTIAKALGLVSGGGTIVMRGGTYTEHNAIYKPVTIQSYPNEAVWIDGSVPVAGWTRDGVAWRRDNWTTRLDHSPTYTKGAPDSTTVDWQFVNKQTAPMAAHPDQVWVAGKPLRQVGSRNQVTTGTFYLDEGTSKLYVGSNPTGGVRASTIPQALNIRSHSVKLKGIGIRRFAPSVWHVGAVTLEKPNITLENVVVSEMATTGISVQSSNARLDQVTVEWSGMLGIHTRYADGIVMRRVLAEHNNSERFNIAPVSGGAKLGSTRGVTVVESNFRNNYGQGFWEDMSVYNTKITDSNFTGNLGNGLFLEISAKAIVANSLFASNRIDGIKVNNTSDVQIWNNTFVGNGRPVNLVQDARRNNDRNNPAVDRRISWPDPAMPWQTQNVTVSNNVIALPTTAANCLICVEDYSHKETGEQMQLTLNGNAYNRASASKPTWLAIWSRGTANPSPYVLTTLAAFRNVAGQEARGQEFTGEPLVSSTGVVSGTITSRTSQIALPLPSAVATAIGRPAGTVKLGLFDGASTPQDPQPPAPEPAPAPAPAPAHAPAPGSTIARDTFGRTTSNGWGAADKGGAWGITGRSSAFAVGGGVARISLLPGDGFGAKLSGVSTTTADVDIHFALDRKPTGDGHYASLIGRQVGGADYRAKARIDNNGGVTIWLVNTATNKTLTGTSLTNVRYAAGDTVRSRLVVKGTAPTTVRAKIWNVNQSEPGWQVSATDTTSSLQRAGAVGIEAYASAKMTDPGVTVSVDDMLVKSAA